MAQKTWPKLIMNVFPLLFGIIVGISPCMAATNFCSQPLGMEEWIIADTQITASSSYNANTHSAKEARLNSARSWCSKNGTNITEQWVKVDLKKPMSITGIKIQGDANNPANYITKFKLDYNYDGGTVFYDKIDGVNRPKVYTGSSGPNQTTSNLFLRKPFTARYVRLRPLEISAGANHVCARFELYGCAYVCNAGLGLENGSSLPSGVAITASSAENGKEAVNGRLSGPSAWCGNANRDFAYLQIDFGKTVTMSGFAIQGDPLQDNWVEGFEIQYGTTLGSLEAYSEGGSIKVFKGNKDRNTMVVHWFQVRLTAQYVRLRLWFLDIESRCLRVEVIGCDSEFVGEVGAENRVLDDSRFTAYGHHEWTVGRYKAKDGRLNNAFPWGNKWDKVNPWFRVDLGRIMLVNGISTQGNPRHGSNYFINYRLEFSLQDSGTPMVYVKQENSSAVKVFVGNINNMGVKFNFLKKSPISARYIQFREKTKTLGDYSLRIEVYARPQVCTESFGLMTGEQLNAFLTITPSGGVIPPSKARLNSYEAWCGKGNATSLLYDFGSERQVNGIAIQGNPVASKWVTSFKVQFGSSSSSLTTYNVSGVHKVFVGCNSRDLIVYNWFSSEITTRYLKIIPVAFESEACLRLNIYGCPASGCFKRVGVESSASVPDSLLTSSTSMSGNEAHKSRLNAASVWSACQVGSCSPKEAAGSKPWIQLCLATSQMVSGVVIQGFGQIEDLAHVTTFTIKYSYNTTGMFYDYKIKGLVKTFAASAGRYGSKQINFPTVLAARCIRLVVQSQSTMAKNVGLRWEVLGCPKVPLKIGVNPSTAFVARGQATNITCTAYGQLGLAISFNSNGRPVVESNTHSLKTQLTTDQDIFGSTSRGLRITAVGHQIASSYGACVLTNATAGHVRCQRSYQCSATYPGTFTPLGLKNFTVFVTGLMGKPRPPTGLLASTITQTSVKISWTASTGSDFPVGSYKVSVYRKQDGGSAAKEQNVNSSEATFSGLTCGKDYTVEVSARSAMFSVYSDKQTLSFRTSLKGQDCESKSKPCDAKPCKHEGVCRNVGKNGKLVFACGCREGYGGVFCEYYYADSTISVSLKLEKSQAFNETAFKLAIAKSLNNHCTKRPDNCPKTSSNSKAKSQQNSPKPYAFKPADIRMLPGYPKTKPDGVLEVRFYVVVLAGSTGARNSTSTLMAVFNANEVKRSLEEKADLSSFGFQIQSVELVKNRNEITSQKSVVSGTLVTVVAVLAVFLLIAFAVIAYLLFRRARRLASEGVPKIIPQKSSGENYELSEAGCEVNKYVFEMASEKGKN